MMKFVRREHDQMRRLGLTLIELVVAIGILSILGWALVLLLSSGMTTWRTGEMRRGAYERAQFIFDRIARDLASLYPHSPPMPEEWAFQADTLFDAGYEGAADEAVSFASDNISLIEDDVRHLKPTDSGEEAWIEYQFDLPFEVKTAVVQPKITLSRSDVNAATCKVIVEAAKDQGAFTQVATFTSGLRDMTITPNVDISSVVSGSAKIAVRLRIVPEPGKLSDIKLFEARQDEPVRPIFRFAASPRECLTEVQLVSDYDANSEQSLQFARSARGLQEVRYYVADGVLYRAQRELGSPSWQAAAMAKSIAYFGCEFQNKYDDGGDDEGEKRLAAFQSYWLEADSVPPYVTVTVSTIPLSGPKQLAHLAAGISADDETIRVAGTRPFVLGNPRRQFVKIGAEWIRYAGLENDRFTGCVRGERGTTPSAHEKGSDVIGAETFWVNIPIPAWGYRNR